LAYVGWNSTLCTALGLFHTDASTRSKHSRQTTDFTIVRSYWHEREHSLRVLTAVWNRPYVPSFPSRGSVCVWVFDALWRHIASLPLFYSCLKTFLLRRWCIHCSSSV